MGVMITYHGPNNPVYNVHTNVSAHYTQPNMVPFYDVLLWPFFCACLGVGERVGSLVSLYGH